MRIVHIAQSIPGGIASYLEEIAEYQAKCHGIGNVFFFVPEASFDHLPTIRPEQLITFRDLGRTPVGLLAFGLAALKAIDRINPAIVHLHSTFAGAVLRPLLALRRDRPRIVYCPHGWAFGMEIGAAKRHLYAGCEALLAAVTDVIVVNSDTEHSLGLQNNIPAPKMVTIRNGIAAEQSIASRTDREPIHLAFIGRHDRQKGLDILLDEIAQPGCEHIHLHVVGKPVLKGVSPILHVPRNITFYGWLSRVEVLALLPKMDAVVMPSRWEAFGLTAIEAMRSGVPVIASNRGALPEIVRHGRDGLIVDISKPGDLGRVLASLDRRELRRFGKAARARFRTEFTSNRMNFLIDTLYHGLVSGDPPGIWSPIPTRCESGPPARQSQARRAAANRI